MDIDKYMNAVINEIDDIIKLFNKSKYNEIIMNYVINPYITTNDPEMKKVADWIRSIKDEKLLRLLSIGIYADKSSIVTRNGYTSPKLNINVKEIFEELLSNNDLKTNEETLYINCAGYIWNLFHENIDLWRKIRKSILNQKRSLRNIYGISHILLQASNFYTKRIDEEYSEELEIISDILEKHRLKGYKDISLDLLCELSLCLKYAKHNYREYEFAKEHINKTISENEIIFTTEKTNNIIKDIINNEHTNALYILLQKLNRKI
jgi:hypothetical protein